jgi:hypothetical protein
MQIYAQTHPLISPLKVLCKHPVSGQRHDQRARRLSSSCIMGLGATTPLIFMEGPVEYLLSDFHLMAFADLMST